MHYWITKTLAFHTTPPIKLLMFSMIRRSAVPCTHPTLTPTKFITKHFRLGTCTKKFPHPITILSQLQLTISSGRSTMAAPLLTKVANPETSSSARLAGARPIGTTSLYFFQHTLYLQEQRKIATTRSFALLRPYDKSIRKQRPRLLCPSSPLL